MSAPPSSGGERLVWTGGGVFGRSRRDVEGAGLGPAGDMATFARRTECRR